MQGDTLFNDIIAKGHPFYDLISQKIPRLPTLFDALPNDHTQTHQSKLNLKMSCRQTPNQTCPTFIYSFVFPCAPQQYLKVCKDYQLQKRVDRNLDQFKILKDLEVENTQYLYLAYKKVLFISARYFVYIRFTFYREGQIWMIAVSDPKAEQIQGKTKADILLTVTRIKKHQEGCEVSVFSQVDMKMKLTLQTAKNRGFIQIKKYIEKLVKQVQKPA